MVAILNTCKTIFLEWLRPIILKTNHTKRIAENMDILSYVRAV